MKKSTNAPLIFLTGKKVTLRPVSLADVPHMTRWINDPEVRKFLKRWFPMTEHGEVDWVNGLSKKSDTDVVLVVEVKGTPIGTMGIHKICWKDRTAVTGALIGEKKYQGKGYGTDAKMTLLEYGFNTLGLRKFVSQAYAFNTASITYSLKCGYVEEGRLKKQRLVAGEYHDEVILGLFREQWLPRWELYKANKSLSLSPSQS